MQKAKEKSELEKKYPELGKKVRRKGRSKWEKGIIVLEDNELYIKYGDDDLEQLCGLPYEMWNEDKNKWEK